ncbi:MAG: hypothetical protein KTR24_14255 [Saprospiraceae bacterium]|nr:hypothetical protein [Saprospiraceae bacterium]
MICTILAVLLLVIVLVTYLRAIIKLLNHIGGAGDSYLAKLRLGLRAIETETGHLPTEVIKLNQALSDTADGLVVVNKNLEGTISAVTQQKV